MGKGDTFLNAVIGAVVTVVLSFTGFSPLLGGGVAGYLQRESRKSGAKVGAISGAIAFLPFLFVLFLFFGFAVVGPVVGGFGMPGGIELVVIFFIIFPFIIAWNVVLGAIGGYLGVLVREEFGSDDR
jgi:hypothetical protein